MTRTARWSMLLALGVVLSVGLFAAGSQEGSGTSEGRGEAEISLDLLSFQNEYVVQFQDMAAQYGEEHPGVTLHPEVLGADYLDILRTRTASNNMPDIFAISGGAWLTRMEEYYVDLTDEPFMENVLPASLPSVTLDGRILSLPHSLTGYGIVYNKAIFRENGLEVPETFGDLEEICEVLETRGVTPFINMFKENWNIGQFINYGIASSPNPVGFLGDLIDRDASIGDLPTFTENLRFFDLMLKYGQDRPLNADWNTGVAMFARGEGAMIHGGLWLYDTIASVNPDNEPGMFAPPFNDNPSRSKLAVDISAAYSVFNGSDHVDACLDVFEWWVNSPGGQQFIQECVVIPVYDGVPVPQVNPIVADISRYAQANMTYQWTQLLWPEGGDFETGTVYQSYVTGQFDKSQVIEGLDAFFKSK